MDKRTCHTCNSEYQPKTWKQKWCSKACKPTDADHPKIQVPCAACGTLCSKEPSQVKKYASVYCSLFCRDYTRCGPQSCAIPADHWARMYGTTSEWQPPTPKAPPIFRCGTCGDCGSHFVARAYSTPSAWCSNRCARRVARRARKAREHNAPGTFRYSDIMRQYRKQGYTCAYCHQPCDGLPDPEHVTPLSKGGRNDMSNIVAACRPCNADKRDVPLNQWNEDRARRGLNPIDDRLIGAAFAHLMQ